MLSGTPSGVAPSRSVWLEWIAAEAPKIPFIAESAECKSIQGWFGNICGQIGLRVSRYDVCNRLAYACFSRSCQKSMDFAGMRPAEHRCHARDLSALIDRVPHGGNAVGICRKHRVKVFHHAILIDEGMRPVEAGVDGASYHLAPAVDAGGQGGKISRQSAIAEDFDFTVLPKYGTEGSPVRAATLPNDLALVVNCPGDVGTLGSKARKRESHAVFPQHRVMRSDAVSQVAYDLALLVDALCLPVWIASHRRKSLGFAAFPYHR